MAFNRGGQVAVYRSTDSDAHLSLLKLELDRGVKQLEDNLNRQFASLETMIKKLEERGKITANKQIELDEELRKMYLSMEQRVETCESLQSRATAGIEWATKPNHLLFANIPEIGHENAVDAFSFFLKSKLRFRDEQLELLQIKKVYRTPIRNSESNSRPILVKFMNKFDRDWVHERALQYLDSNENLVSEPGDTTVKLKRLSHQGDSTTEESRDHTVIDPASIKVLDGGPIQCQNIEFVGFIARIRSHSSVKPVIRRVMESMEKQGNKRSVLHIPYAFRISKTNDTWTSYLKNLIKRRVQEERKDDGDRDARPGQLILGEMRNYKWPLGVGNCIVLVAMARQLRHVQGQFTLPPDGRRGAYAACVRNVLERHGGQMLLEDNRQMLWRVGLVGLALACVVLAIVLGFVLI